MSEEQDSRIIDRQDEQIIKLTADLADARQKLAEAQAECAAKADALREITELLPSDEPFAWDRKMREIAAAALASNAGDALVKELESLRRRVKALPADWLEDSSLETWFPLTAKELERLRAEMAKAHEETRWWHQCLTLVSHALTGNTEALTNLSEDSDWKRAFECVAFQQAKDLRAQRDQAVSLAKSESEIIDWMEKQLTTGSGMIAHNLWHGKTLRQDVREQMANESLNPPPSDDTLKV